MTRRASTAKAGFFPTPKHVTELVTCLIIPSTHRGRLLDSGCVEGIAAQCVAIARDLNAKGIEIDADRALEVSEHLHRLRYLDYAGGRAPPHGFQVLFVNPTYGAPRQALSGIV